MIQSSTAAAVSAIHSVSGKVGEVQAFAGTIAAAVEEQTAAAQEIANNVALAAEASGKAANSSTEVSEVAGRTKEQATSVSNVSSRLSDVRPSFRQPSRSSWAVSAGRQPGRKPPLPVPPIAPARA